LEKSGVEIGRRVSRVVEVVVVTNAKPEMEKDAWRVAAEERETIKSQR
jgi:hypothetical protein